jgi:C3HC zinc finger-like
MARACAQLDRDASNLELYGRRTQTNQPFRRSSPRARGASLSTSTKSTRKPRNQGPPQASLGRCDGDQKDGHLPEAGSAARPAGKSRALRPCLSQPQAGKAAPVARPWDRLDFFRRLHTFKAGTWFCKPPAVGPLPCARAGWTNTAVDILACEVGAVDHAGRFPTLLQACWPAKRAHAAHRALAAAVDASAPRDRVGPRKNVL